jgi:hypothetical protein
MINLSEFFGVTLQKMTYANGETLHSQNRLL